MTGRLRSRVGRFALVASSFASLSYLVDCKTVEPTPKTASRAIPSGIAPSFAPRETSQFTLEYADSLPRGAVRVDDRRWIVFPPDDSPGAHEGTRLEWLASGVLRTSLEPLSTKPRQIVRIPEHLGHGWLFVIHNRIFRSEEWLGALSSPTSFPSTIAAVHVGLDRLYVVDEAGRIFALDGTGEIVPVVGWPTAPNVSQFAAVDALRAVAAGDVIGSTVTFDGGRTFLPIEPQLTPNRTEAIDGKLYVQALGNAPRASAPRTNVIAQTSPPSAGGPWYEIQPNGHAEPRDLPRREAPPRLSPKRSALSLAVESGWPFEDGTILYVEEGAAVRLRESDGSLVSRTALDPRLAKATCQATRLGDGIGFVCTTTMRTSIVKVDRAGQFGILREFPRKRRVTSSGNGALVISGGCEEGEENAASFCVHHVTGRWQDVSLAGGTGREHLVARRDESLLVLRPPNETTEGTTILFARGKTHATAINADQCGLDLRSAVWLDGFEERDDGTFGGWLLTEQKFVAVSFDANGQLAQCTPQAQVGPTIVSGRYGLTWSENSASQTIDGGKTWSIVQSPAKIKEEGRAERRACGAAGCVAFGWVRTGWDATSTGASPKKAGVVVPVPRRDPAPRIALDCAVTSVRSGDPAAAARAFMGHDLEPKDDPRLPFFGVSPKLGAPPPERVDLHDVRDEGASMPVGRVYVFGEGGLMGSHVDFSVAWIDPFGRASQVFSSDHAHAPSIIADNSSPISIVRRSSPAFGRSGSGLMMRLIVDEDPRSGVLLARMTYGTGVETAAFAIQERAAPQPIVRATGEPFREIDSAARVGNTRYLLSTTSQGDEGDRVLQSELYRVDGTTARLLATIPRNPRTITRGGWSRTARLAPSTDGHSIAIMFDGEGIESSGDHWLLQVDSDSGAFGMPVLVKDPVLATLHGCREGDEGFRYSASFPGSITARIDSREESGDRVFARWIFNGTEPCLEALHALGSETPKSGGKRAVAKDAITANFISASSSTNLSCKTSSP